MTHPARTEAIAMTRCCSRRRSRRAAYPHRAFHPARILLFALLAVLLVGGWEPLAATVFFGFPLLMMVLAGAVTVTLVRRGHWVWRHYWVAPERAYPPPAPIPPPRPAPDWRAEWRAARRRFDALRAEYAAYECDPLAVLRLPALADVTVPSTARFVDAFAEAQALDTDTPPPAEHARSYRWAVDRAWRAWRAATDAAERIRLSGLSQEERASVQRVIKLLTMAKESGNDAERLAAYAKARAELAKLERAGRISLPKPAAAALDAAARAGLPAAPRLTAQA
jgi:hypothetical protein